MQRNRGSGRYHLGCLASSSFISQIQACALEQVKMATAFVSDGASASRASAAIKYRTRLSSYGVSWPPVGMLVDAAVNGEKNVGGIVRWKAKKRGWWRGMAITYGLRVVDNEGAASSCREVAKIGVVMKAYYVLAIAQAAPAARRRCPRPHFAANGKNLETYGDHRPVAVGAHHARIDAAIFNVTHHGEKSARPQTKAKSLLSSLPARGTSLSSSLEEGDQYKHRD